MSLTTLPSIPVGGKVTQQVLLHSPNLVQHKLQTSRPYRKRFDTTKKTQAKSNEATKTAESKEFIDTARHRYAAKHNLCLDMLQDGFHEAFCELFNLLKKNRELAESEAQNKDEIPVLIEDEIEKLDVLKRHLMSAEASRRRGRMDAVYEAQMALATYFDKTGDAWLADHFFVACLETGLVVHGDNRRKETEAYYNLGLAAEKRDELEQAVEHFEKCYELTADKPWECPDGRTLYQHTCDSLRGVYTRIADEIESDNPELSIQYFAKAHEMGQKSGDEGRIAYAGYLLGNAYERHGEPETAILYHKSFLEYCKAVDDQKGIGDACQALARAYQRLNDIDHAIEYLELFIDVSEGHEDLAAQEAACSEMGALHDSLGKYQQASHYFNKAYTKAKNLNDASTVDLSRVKCGVAQGHCMFLEIANKIVINDKAARNYLIEWKSTRSRDELITNSNIEQDRDNDMKRKASSQDATHSSLAEESQENMDAENIEHSENLES